MTLPAPWRLKILDARRVVVDAMSDAEREEMKAGQAAARVRSTEKKAAKTDLMRKIVAMHDDGHDAHEIGKAVGLRERRVRDIAASHGVLITRSDAKVRRAIVLERDRETFLRRLAADHRTTPSQTIAELVAAVLEHDAAVARKVLGVRKRATCAQSVVPMIPVKEAREALSKGRPARRRPQPGDEQPATIGEARAALSKEIAARRAQQDDGRLATIEDFLGMAASNVPLEQASPNVPPLPRLTPRNA